MATPSQMTAKPKPNDSKARQQQHQGQATATPNQSNCNIKGEQHHAMPIMKQQQQQAVPSLM